MQGLIDSLRQKGTVLTDGSWGTQIMKRGLKAGESPDSWNLSHPHMIEEVAREYVEAGSSVILTNTFGANRFVLAKFGLENEVASINRTGVEISRSAAGGRSLVFASMGPSGKMLAARNVTGDALASAFEEQAAALAGAGADAIVVETMMDLNEALIAARAAKATGLPVIACLVFDAGKQKDRTMMGNTPEQAVEAFTAIGVDGMGANCGQGIEGFIPICRRMRAVTALPLWMKPNAGLPERVDGKVVYRTTAPEFADRVPELIESGASFIGGCCGTEQSFIREIARVLFQKGASHEPH